MKSSNLASNITLKDPQTVGDTVTYTFEVDTTMFIKDLHHLQEPDESAIILYARNLKSVRWHKTVNFVVCCYEPDHITPSHYVLSHSTKITSDIRMRYVDKQTPSINIATMQFVRPLSKSSHMFKYVLDRLTTDYKKYTMAMEFQRTPIEAESRDLRLIVLL